jgi:cell division protein FtsI/penicillin-binding protein 2
MFISFGMFIGLIFLTILMIIAIIFLTFTGPKNDQKEKQHASYVEQARKQLQKDQHSHLESRQILQETQKTELSQNQQQDSVPVTPEDDPFKILPYPNKEEKGV